MTEPYILILNALLLSGGNYAMWWLLFDDEFDTRLRTFQSTQRNRMMTENEGFVSQMKGIIELDPEAMEVDGFGERGQEKIDGVDRLRHESETLKTRIVWVYYVAILSIGLASLGVTIPAGIQITQTFTFYFTALSWWTVMVDLVLMLGLLTHYQLIELRTVPKTEGTAISGDSGFQKIITGLRKRGKD
ncbi:MAG: hypothetical protein ACERKS_00470 [Candidatus Bathyarchaeota archaeon]